MNAKRASELSSDDIEKVIEDNWETIYKMLYRKLYHRCYYKNNNKTIRAKSLDRYHKQPKFDPTIFDTIVDKKREENSMKKVNQNIVIDFHK